MYEYYSYIRRRGGAVSQGGLAKMPWMLSYLLSFCSFEEEGNETNHKKTEVFEVRPLPSRASQYCVCVNV